MEVSNIVDFHLFAKDPETQFLIAFKTFLLFLRLEGVYKFSTRHF